MNVIAGQKGFVARPALERFCEKVNKNGPLKPHMATRCWLWGAGHEDRYNQFWVDRWTRIKAHRFAWEIVNGPMPTDLDALHLCDTKGCVRPDHIHPGTAKQNSLEALERQRLGYALISHCKRGHPFDAENTRIHQEKGRPGGWRICRACARIRIQEFLARRAALSGAKAGGESAPPRPGGET